MREKKSCVLFSGGWESTACAVKSLEEDCLPPVTDLLFFEYNQPYLKQERVSTKAIADALGLTLLVCPLDTMKTTDGVFEDRNETFIRVAKSLGYNSIWFGARGPFESFDRHKDSNIHFANKVSKELNVDIKTPLIGWPKFFIRRYIQKHSSVSHLVWSSEDWRY